MNTKSSFCSNYRFMSLKNISTVNILCAPVQATILIDCKTHMTSAR